MANDTTVLKKLSKSSIDRKYKLVFSSRFKKACKKHSKSGKYDFNKIIEILDILSRGQELNLHHRDHALKANWNGYRECHIYSDLLLIYKFDNDELQLANIGNHSELFG